MRQADWDARYSETDLVWSAGPNRFLVEEVEDMEPGRALDLACGEGRNAIWLASKGWIVRGVDFSAVALGKAMRIAADRKVEVEWVKADLDRYEPEAAAFDLVLLFYLQVPRPNLERVLRQAQQAVAPGGTLLVVGHDATNLTEGWGGPKDPAVLYTPDDVVPVLDALEIVKAEQPLREVKTDEGTKQAIDCLVRAHRPAA